MHSSSQTLYNARVKLEYCSLQTHHIVALISQILSPNNIHACLLRVLASLQQVRITPLLCLNAAESLLERSTRRRWEVSCLFPETEHLAGVLLARTS